MSAARLTADVTVPFIAVLLLADRGHRCCPVFHKCLGSHSLMAGMRTPAR